MDLLRMRGIARFILVLWAGWWTFFVAACVAATHDITATKLMAFALAAIVFGGSVAVSWHCEEVGSILLILEGVLACVAFPLGFFPTTGIESIFLVAGLALPPIVCGIMLLECWYHCRPPGPHHHGPTRV